MDVMSKYYCSGLIICQWKTIGFVTESVVHVLITESGL